MTGFNMLMTRAGVFYFIATYASETTDLLLFFEHALSYGVSVTCYVFAGNQLEVVQRGVPWR